MLEQVATIQTPDTAAYMVAAYLAIGAILALYALSLLARLRRAKEDR